MVRRQRCIGIGQSRRRRRGVRVGHRRARDGALARELLQAEQSQETVAKFRRHEIVQDGVDGRVEVDHDATEIDEHVVVFGTLLQAPIVDDREQAERQKANEEAHHHRSQHCHHLPFNFNTSFINNVT